MARRWVVAAGIIGFPVALCAGWLGWIGSQMPSPQGPRLEGPHGLVGVETGGAYAWIVPVAGGVALVDAGMDPEATAILAELSGRGLGAADVKAVFVTHGHLDHTLGLTAFPSAEVWLGPGEGPLVRGEVAPSAFMPRLFSTIVRDRPTLPAIVREGEDGAGIEVGGEVLRMVHTPGHTAGSAVYQWRDVVFSGDTFVHRDDGLTKLPNVFAEDAGLLRAAMFKVIGLRFETVADGHAGLSSDGNAALRRYLDGP